MSQTSKTENKSSSLFGAALFVVGALLMSAPLLIILIIPFTAIRFLTSPQEDSDNPPAIDPSEAFQQLTGWKMPQDAAVLENRNNHSGFKNDGDYLLRVRMIPGQLRALVDSDSNTWCNCPIAPEIAESALELPDHTGTMYYAKKTSSSDTDWHCGHVVIVNPETGFVWIYEWKI